jgi:hypothetical protein
MKSPNLLKAWARGDERALDRLTPFVDKMGSSSPTLDGRRRTSHIATGMRGSRADRQEPAPYRYANQLRFQVENYILNVKREHSVWGARKIRERLLRRFPGIPIAPKSTIHAVLDRHGLVERRGPVRRRSQGTPLSFMVGQRPNELWCTDSKDEFLLGNYP